MLGYTVDLLPSHLQSLIQMSGRCQLVYIELEPIDLLPLLSSELVEHLWVVHDPVQSCSHDAEADGLLVEAAHDVFLGGSDGLVVGAFLGQHRQNKLWQDAEGAQDSGHWRPLQRQQ
jgi:hypothetical protein